MPTIGTAPAQADTAQPGDCDITPTSPPELRLSPDSEKNQIKDLKWQPIQFQEKQIKGIFIRPGWNLLVNNQSLKLTQSGHFQFPVSYEAKITPIEVMAIGPLGETEKEKLDLFYPDWDACKLQTERTQISNNASHATHLSTGLGMTTLSYSQTNKADFSMAALTAKISFQKPLKFENWDIGITTFATALPISNNQSDISVYFFGFNFRVGYVPKLIQNPWTLSLMLGGYYTTMIVSPNRFGYTNVYGPQFFPALSRLINTQNRISAYLKFSPVTDGTSILSLSTREVGAGLNWSHVFENNHTFSITLDFAELTLNSAGIIGKSSSITAGGAWSLF